MACVLTQMSTLHKRHEEEDTKLHNLQEAYAHLQIEKDKLQKYNRKMEQNGLELSSEQNFPTSTTLLDQKSKQTSVALNDEKTQVLKLIAGLVESKNLLEGEIRFQKWRKKQHEILQAHVQAWEARNEKRQRSLARKKKALRDKLLKYKSELESLP